MSAAAADIEAFTRLHRFEELSERVATHYRTQEWMSAVRCAGALMETLRPLLENAIQEAYNDGATKRAIADAIGVTPATFRGMERTR